MGWSSWVGCRWAAGFLRRLRGELVRVAAQGWATATAAADPRTAPSRASRGTLGSLGSKRNAVAFRMEAIGSRRPPLQPLQRPRRRRTRGSLLAARSRPPTLALARVPPRAGARHRPTRGWADAAPRRATAPPAAPSALPPLAEGAAPDRRTSAAARRGSGCCPETWGPPTLWASPWRPTARSGRGPRVALPPATAKVSPFLATGDASEPTS